MKRLVSIALIALTGCAKVDSRWEKTRGPKPARVVTPQLQERLVEVAQNPTSAEVRDRLAAEYSQLDRLREAAEEYRRALTLDPQDVDAIMGLWQISSRLLDAGNAVALAERAQRLNPQDPATRPALLEAATALDQALDARPTDLWILLNAALCQTKLKNYQRAEQYIARATAAVPNAVTPRLMLGSLYLEQGLVAQAADAFDRLAAQQPNNALVREALGRVRRSQGRWQDAVIEFAAAQRLRPNWQTPYLNAGDAYLRMGDVGSALDQFVKALKLAPHSLPAGLGMIQALAAQREYEKALVQCEAMLADYPDHPMLLNNLAYFLAQKGGDLDRAVSISRKLLQSYPNQPVILDTAGWANLRSGNTTEALRLLQEATRLAPSSAMAFYHLGKAQLTANRKSDAVQSFQTALKLGLVADEKRDTEKELARR